MLSSQIRKPNLRKLSDKLRTVKRISNNVPRTIFKTDEILEFERKRWVILSTVLVENEIQSMIFKLKANKH